jgi:NAD(P)-dependent dehydrogenase (short-subunit alcohol dehydrogenase family)
MNKKLLVTGGSGFIGTHCILELLNNGYQVVGTVRDLDRTDQIVSNLKKHIKNINRLEFAYAELTDSQSWAKAMQLAWYNGQTGKGFPDYDCGPGDRPPWQVFSDSRGANLTIDVNEGTYLFIYLTM